MVVLVFGVAYAVAARDATPLRTACVIFGLAVFVVPAVFVIDAMLHELEAPAAIDDKDADPARSVETGRTLRGISAANGGGGQISIDGKSSGEVSISAERGDVTLSTRKH